MLSFSWPVLVLEALGALFVVLLLGRFAGVVRRKVDDANVIRIYLATLGLGTAYGMAISVIAVFLTARGYHEADIRYAGGLVRRRHHDDPRSRRAKSVEAAGRQGGAGDRPTYVRHDGRAFSVRAELRLDYSTAILRRRSLSIGVVSVETILVARARREIKAYVTSVYGMSIAVGYGAGSLGAFLAAKVLPNERVFTAVAGALSALLTGLFALLRLDKSSGRAPRAGKRPAPPQLK